MPNDSKPVLQLEWSGIGFGYKDGSIVHRFRGGFIEAETKITIEVAQRLSKQLNAAIAKSKASAGEEMSGG